MRNPYMKFQDNISFQNIIVAKFQRPKFRKMAKTQKVSYFFPIFHIFFYLSSPINWHKFEVSIFNTFRDAAFTKFHPLSKGRNFTREDNSGKAKITWQLFFHWESIWYVVSRRYLDAPYIHTDKPTLICLHILAHLSRRLVSELTVYPWSGVRPASSSVVHNFKHEYLCNQWTDRNQILSEA